MHKLLFLKVLSVFNEAENYISRNRYSLKYKNDGSPVTQVDIFLEEKLKACLYKEIPGDREYIVILPVPIAAFRRSHLRILFRL